jgi:hypothetical protein
MTKIRVRNLALLVVLVFSIGFPGTAQAHGSQRRVFAAVLLGRNEVPPVSTRAVGFAFFKLSDDGNSLKYSLAVAKINNVVASHIHLGVPGANGPVVAFLYGPAAPGGGSFNGLLAHGTLTSASLVGPLAGQPLSALLTEILNGNTYVNVHTNDGVDPTNTGAGDMAGGEIRGKIY